MANSQLTGTRNIDDVLGGPTTISALRDWSVSIFTDDNVPTTTVALRQPSWNFTQALPAVGLSFTLAPRVLSDAIMAGLTLQGGGSSYLRFAVPQNREALLQVTGFAGAPLAPGMRLTVVRIK